MARIPYTGAADVEPAQTLPDDYQHEDVSSEAFGGQVGQALEKAGGQLLTTARFYEGAAADQATNNYIEQQTKLLYGDISKPATGPDGKPLLTPEGAPVGEGGFYTLRGQDALNATPQVQQQIDDLIAQERKGLKTPRAQLQFDTDTRRYRAAEDAKMGVFVDDQHKTWAQQVNNQSIAVTTNGIGLHLSDPAALEDDQHALRDAYVKNDELLYGQTPQIQQAATLKADQAFYSTQAQALVLNGPTAAAGLKVLQDHADIFAGDPHYYQFVREAQRASLAYAVGTASDPTAVAAFRAANPQAETPAAPGAPTQISVTDAAPHTADLQRYQGFRDRFSSELGVTPAAAAGIVSPGVWESGMRTIPEGKSVMEKAGQTGEPDFGFFQLSGPRRAAYFSWAQQQGLNPNDPQTNEKYTIYDLKTNYPGLLKELQNPNLTPRQAATIFFNGYETGGSKKLAAQLGEHIQYANAIAGHGLGTSTETVQSGVGAHAPAAGTVEDSYLASVRTNLHSLFPNDPDLVETGVKQVESNIKRDDTQGTQAFDRSARSEIEYASNPDNDLSQATMTPDQVRAGPGDAAKNAVLADQLQAAREFHDAYHQIAQQSDADAQKTVDSYRPSGPTDYDVKAPEYEAMQKALDARRQAIAQDPVGYVRTNFKDVDQLALNMWGSAQGFAAYTARLDATYAALGIPDNNRPILAAGVAHNIVSAVDTRAPQDAATALRQAETVAGGDWPRLFQQLRLTGLPAGLSTAISLGGADSNIMITALQADATAKAEKNETLAKQLEGHSFTIPAAGGKKARTEGVETLIEQTMSSDTNLAAFASAWGNTGRIGIEQFAGLSTAIKVTAQYLFLQNPTQNPIAVTQRAIGMVTGRYDFVPQSGNVPVMLPKGQAQNFRVLGPTSAHALTEADVLPYPGQGPEEYRRQEALRGAHAAYWVTIPGVDGKGAIRAMDPTSQSPVMLRGNKTFDIPFSQLPALASRASQQVNDAARQEMIRRAFLGAL